VETSAFTTDETRRPRRGSPWPAVILATAVIILSSPILLSIPIGRLLSGPVIACVQNAHAIGLALYSYANDNNQQYPDGSSSTEAFQKLLDGGYVTDPAIFYIPMPGKVKASAGQKLKPENVCWDLTAPAESREPLALPLLFITGYKVNYVPGGVAVPLNKDAPLYGTEPFRGTILQGPFSEAPYRKGVAVFYIDSSTTFLTMPLGISSDGSIPNFVPTDFKPDATVYRQLTPDGVLK
jgi:hypothetical protein